MIQTGFLLLLSSNLKVNDDELQLQFDSTSGATPMDVTGEIASPETQYRNASFQFATTCIARLDELDSFNLYPSKQLAVEPTFCSSTRHFQAFRHLPTLLKLWQYFRPLCSLSVRVEKHWTLCVSWFCVAEEIAFSILLAKEPSNEGKYEVAFHHKLGDKMVFHQLAECIRARCSEVDAEPLFLAELTLKPWLDASQELKGRRYAICDTEAEQLIKEMNSELDADTLYEVAKMVKNHCRHHSNRRLFFEARAGFVQAIKWMLADSEVLARFAAFILLQYAYEACDGENVDLFLSAFERNSVVLLLAELECRESESHYSQFTIPAFEWCLIHENTCAPGGRLSISKRSPIAIQSRSWLHPHEF